MFVSVLEFAQNLMSVLNEFASSILNFLGYQFEILGNTYSLFGLLFSSSVVFILTYGITKFIINIFG